VTVDARFRLTKLCGGSAARLPLTLTLSRMRERESHRRIRPPLPLAGEGGVRVRHNTHRHARRMPHGALPRATTLHPPIHTFKQRMTGSSRPMQGLYPAGGLNTTKNTHVGNAVRFQPKPDLLGIRRALMSVNDGTFSFSRPKMHWSALDHKVQKTKIGVKAVCNSF